MIDLKLYTCGAVVMGNAMLGLDKQDKYHSLCTAIQSLTMANGRAGKGCIGASNKVILDMCINIDRHRETSWIDRGQF